MPFLGLRGRYLAAGFEGVFFEGAADVVEAAFLVTAFDVLEAAEVLVVAAALVGELVVLEEAVAAFFMFVLVVLEEAEVFEVAAALADELVGLEEAEALMDVFVVLEPAAPGFTVVFFVSSFSASWPFGPGFTVVSATTNPGIRCLAAAVMDNSISTEIKTTRFITI